MPGMKRLSRRQFSQKLTSAIASASIGKLASAHDGPREVPVEVSDFVFVPEVVQIWAGDTVIWTNEDIAPHAVTAADGSWETASLDQGKTARVLFDGPGTYDYYCVFHPRMTGRIIVR